MSKIIEEIQRLNTSISEGKNPEMITPLISTFLANQENIQLDESNYNISFNIGEREVKIPIGSNHISYLKTVGFPNGDNTEFTPIKKTYTPLIKTEKHEDNAIMETPLINYIINEIAEISDFHFKSMLMTIFGEIIENIKEHSQYSKRFLFCQKWDNNTLQIAIMDNGVGFKGSLKEENEATALDLAVCNRVSCRKNYEDKKGIGLGLQHLKASVLNDEVKGEFCAISNKDYIHFGEQGQTKGKLDFSCNGVMIILIFNNLDKANFQEAFNKTLMPEELLIEKGYLNPTAGIIDINQKLGENLFYGREDFNKLIASLPQDKCSTLDFNKVYFLGPSAAHELLLALKSGRIKIINLSEELKLILNSQNEVRGVNADLKEFFK